VDGRGEDMRKGEEFGFGRKKEGWVLFWGRLCLCGVQEGCRSVCPVCQFLGGSWVGWIWLDWRGWDGVCRSEWERQKRDGGFGGG
jgi:hypothetical protein